MNLGYLIEDGKLTRPVKNATLIGTNVQILKEVEMIGNDIGFFLGSCGKGGQSAAGDRRHTHPQDPSDDGGRPGMSARTERSPGAGRDLVAYGRKQGASEIEVTIDEGTEFCVSVLDAEHRKAHRGGLKGVEPARLRGRQGGQRLVLGLHARDARAAGGQRHRARPAGRRRTRSPGCPRRSRSRRRPRTLKIYDPAIAEMPAEKKIALAKAVEAVGLKDKRDQEVHGRRRSTRSLETRILVELEGLRRLLPAQPHLLRRRLPGGRGDNLFEDGWDDVLDQPGRPRGRRRRSGRRPSSA